MKYIYIIIRYHFFHNFFPQFFIFPNKFCTQLLFHPLSASVTFLDDFQYLEIYLFYILYSIYIYIFIFYILYIYI